MSEKQTKTLPNWTKFVFGGASGVGAACIVHPLDLVKTRMQMSGTSGTKEYKNSVHCIQTVVKNEGFFGLYKGLGASLLRQASYTTVRLGTYSRLNDWYKARYKSTPNILSSILMGVIAGACGAYVGTPADVVLIRMASDGRLPPQERRNYANVINALARIAKEEGVPALWRGSLPTVGRAMVVNATQLTTYTQSKLFLRNGPLHMEEGFKLHLNASIISGLVTATISMPVDIAKTRIQNQKTVDGKTEYSGTLDVLLKVTKREGFFALWKGFTPYITRAVPMTILTFIFFEQLNNLYYKHVLGIDSKGSGI